MTDVVAVEDVGGLFVFADELPFESRGNGAFAGSGKAGEPEGDSALVEVALAVGAGDVAVVPGYVGCHGGGGGWWSMLSLWRDQGLERGSGSDKANVDEFKTKGLGGIFSE
mmetsp:Transcript_5224/g.10699  ORF Transcript_5224/g.10699 Transcript_5224/m.10699 type:complete len:111 (-) Transcript_5224:57-389(-)